MSAFQSRLASRRVSLVAFGVRNPLHMASYCPICNKPYSWFDRISQACMCKECAKDGARITPASASEEAEIDFDDDEVIQIRCSEPFGDRINFTVAYAKELHAKVWPFGIQHLLAFVPWFVIFALLTAFFSLSERVFWSSMAIFYANYLFFVLMGILHKHLAARFYRKVFGSDEWICEISRDTVAAKNIGYQSVFYTRDMSHIEESFDFVTLHFGNFGRIRIPLSAVGADHERRVLMRKLQWRMKRNSFRFEVRH